jgi:hypothetical protein
MSEKHASASPGAVQLKKISEKTIGIEEKLGVIN